jgi:CBS domain-containing protein
MLDLISSLKDKRVADCMTSPVKTVRPEDLARTAAEIMLRLKVSGLPVVDKDGKPVGVVSESDFNFAEATTRQKHREIWLEMLAGNEGEGVADEYLDSLEREGDSVAKIMATHPLCVDAATPVEEAAELMGRHRIKRLPVLRDGVVVGIVTRADLLRFFAPQEHLTKPVTPEFFDEEIEAVVKAHSVGKRPASKVEPAPPPEPAPAPGEVTAAELKKIVNEFESNKGRMGEEARRQATAARDELVKHLLNTRYTDPELRQLLMNAREAARRGETGIPALVFPSALCADGGRAINLPDPEWPKTLRGKAADFFLRWDKELRPLGFGLTARIVNFPDGFPGDAELALAWGR